MPSISESIPAFGPERFQAVAIGSSTGGPSLVEAIVKGLPADLSVPLFVAQHMPPRFTESFARTLARASPLSVVHVEQGMPVLPGSVYIGVGHQHMRVVRRAGSVRPVIEVSPEPSSLLYKPSVDELFRSCAVVYRSGVLGVVLTGIGHDGAIGSTAIHFSGGMVISQRKDTCAVYGMPKSCEEAGVSSAQLSPEDIRRTLLQLSPGQREAGRTAAMAKPS